MVLDGVGTAPVHHPGGKPRYYTSSIYNSQLLCVVVNPEGLPRVNICPPH